MTFLLERLAEHFHAQWAKPLAPEAARQGQWLTLDLIGVAIAGVKMRFPTVMRELIAAQSGAAQASLIGHPEPVPAAQAALGNGVAGHALDMDDGYRYGGVHIGVSAIPAALAFAQARGRGGQDYLKAITASYELVSRLARAMNPSHLQRGFHTTGTLGPLGAALACGLLAGLPPPALANALGLAALQSAGLLEVLHDGAMAKPLHPGKAAQAGVLAAQLAERGALGPRSALEGPKGMFHAMADGVNTDALFDGLGKQPPLILDQYIKLHAACRHIHPSIDALLSLMQTHGLKAQDIRAVQVSTYPVAVDFCGSPNLPATAEGAKFSIALSLALAARHGDVAEHRYTEAEVTDAALRRWAGQVSSQAGARWAEAYPRERGATVAITDASGRRLEEVRALAKGEPECPASEQDLLAKFRQNAQGQPAELRQALEAAVMGLEQGAASSVASLLGRVAAA